MRKSESKFLFAQVYDKDFRSDDFMGQADYDLQELNLNRYIIIYSRPLSVDI